MKRAVSISIGSSRRDKKVEITLLGEQVQLERIGTDGDMEKAARLFAELDGRVDALGVGGGLLGLMVGKRWYPMHSLFPLVEQVRRTPVVDGTGLKMTLEKQPSLPPTSAYALHSPAQRADYDRGRPLGHGGRRAKAATVHLGDVLYSLGLHFLSARKRQSTPSPLRLPRCCHVCRLNGCIRWGNPRRNANPRSVAIFNRQAL